MTDAIIQFESKNVKITPYSIEFANGTPFSEWQSVYEKLEQFDGIMQLYIGDCLNFGQYAYGEKYTEFMKHSKYEYDTLRRFSSVANSFTPPLRERLWSQDHRPSFTELRAVAPMINDNEGEKAVQLLELAGECGWNNNRLREEVQKIRHPASPPPEAIDSAGKLATDKQEPEWVENRIVSETPANHIIKYGKVIIEKNNIGIMSFEFDAPLPDGATEAIKWAISELKGALERGMYDERSGIYVRGEME